MQSVFFEPTAWHTPRTARVPPQIEEIAGYHTEGTVFTHFIPPVRPGDMPADCQRYYRRWREMARAEIDPRLLELVPSLARLAPPATVFDKRVYSPFFERGLPSHPRTRHAETESIVAAWPLN